MTLTNGLVHIKTRAGREQYLANRLSDINKIREAPYTGTQMLICKSDIIIWQAKNSDTPAMDMFFPAHINSVSTKHWCTWTWATQYINTMTTAVVFIHFTHFHACPTTVAVWAALNMWYTLPLALWQSTYYRDRISPKSLLVSRTSIKSF